MYGNILSHLSILLDCLKQATQTLAKEHKVQGIMIIKNVEMSLTDKVYWEPPRHCLSVIKSGF